MQFLRKHFILFILGAITVVQIVIRISMEREINRNKIYVAAVIEGKEWLSNGFLYRCSYRFNGHTYKASFSDIRPGETKMVFLKISKERPENWLPVQDKEVPWCITVDN